LTTIQLDALVRAAAPAGRGWVFDIVGCEKNCSEARSPRDGDRAEAPLFAAALW
jgi:hypothetical protein